MTKFLKPLSTTESNQATSEAIAKVIAEDSARVCGICGMDLMGHRPQSRWLGHIEHEYSPIAATPTMIEQARELTSRAYAQRYLREKEIVTTSKPTLGKIRRTDGVAGQFQISAEVTYSGEPMKIVSFVGSEYGSPGVIVMISSGHQIRVDEPQRFGEKLSIDWVRKFFG